MTIRDMVVLLDNASAAASAGSAPSSAPTAATALGAAPALALDLAGRFGAHVDAVALAVDPIVPGFVVAPLPIEVIEQARAQALGAAQAAVRRFDDAAKAAGVSCEARIQEILMGGVPETFVAGCRATDLVVVGQDDPDHPEPMRDTMIESALFDGAAAVLVVPYVTTKPLALDRVTIAWDGGRAAARAVHAALPFLEKAKRITVLMVGKAGSVPGEPGADLAVWLSRHGLDVEIETIEAPEITVADALLDHAADKSVDLLVMGGYGHSRVREFLLGGATRGILASMTVPVLMAH